MISKFKTQFQSAGALLASTFSAAAFAAFILCSNPSALAQSTQTVSSDEESAGIRFSEREEFTWDIGLRLSCVGGQAKGVVVTVPVPIPWAEQDIELIEEIKSDNVGRISFKKLTKEAKMMVFKVTRMGDGESAEAVLRYRVRKSNILPPEDTSKLSIADQVPGKVKTFLKPSPFIESKHKKIRAIAATLQTANTGLSDWEKIEAIYTWVRENIEYKFDNQNFTCLEALESGQGDCGELSSLFIAICRAQGIPARLVWVPGHAYPEFYMTDEEGNGHWFPCQAASARHEFGEMEEARPILQKGDRFRLPLEKEIQAYVKPTAFAADAMGAIQIEEWIMREAGTDENQAPSKTIQH